MVGENSSSVVQTTLILAVGKKNDTISGFPKKYYKSIQSHEYKIVKVNFTFNLNQLAEKIKEEEFF